MSLDARALRERRKARIAVRKTTTANTTDFESTAEGDDDEMPEWLEDKIEDDESEGMDEGMPADLDEEGMEMGSATGAFNYNPVYQKPTHLGNDKPSGGYHYYGPPPDAGTSYGYYLDAEHDIGIIAPLRKKVYSPVSGKVLEYQGKADIDAVASVLAVYDSLVSLGADRMTSAPLTTIATPRVFDVISGKEITAEIDQLRAGEATADDDDMLEDVVMDEGDDLPEDMGDDEPMDEMEGEDDDDMGMGDDDMGDMPMGAEDDMPEDDMPMDESEDDMLMDESEDDMPEDDAEEMPAMMPLQGDESMDDEPMSDDMGDDDMGMGDDDEDSMDDMPEDDMGDEDEDEELAYESLQAVDDFGDEPISESDVHMTLFDDDDGRAQANPYWNIDIKGMPVARVYLRDQPRPDEMRDLFCSADYHRGVSGAVEKVGLAPVLKQIKAHMWANAVQKTKLAKKIRAAVQAESNERVTAVTHNLMRDLLQRVAIVCAAMDKNFYRDVGNPLKEALWDELNRFGITNPSPVIEAAFRRGSTPYFETVLNKAVEYMEMRPDALAQVKQAIGEADVLPAGDYNVGDQLPDATPSAPKDLPTLAERLTASSVAVGGIPAVQGDAIGEHKTSLRRELGLGGAGIRRGR